MRKAGFIRCKSNHRWKFHERRWCRCCQEDELIAMIQELDGETKVCMDHTGRYYPEQCIQNRIGILGMKNRRMLCNIGTELSEQFFPMHHIPEIGLCDVRSGTRKTASGSYVESCCWALAGMFGMAAHCTLSNIGSHPYFCSKEKERARLGSLPRSLAMMTIT